MLFIVFICFSITVFHWFHWPFMINCLLSSLQAGPCWGLDEMILVDVCSKTNRLVGGDWNMTCIFPYIGTNHPNWLSYFWNGMKPPTRRIWIISIWRSQLIQTQRKFKSKSIQIKLNINWERNQPEKSDQFIFSWLTFPLL